MGTNFEVTGLEELTKNLEKASKRVEEVAKEQEVSFGVLFNSEFMKKYTKVSTMQEFLDTFDKDMSNEEFSAQINSKEWNAYVKENSTFDDWNEMYAKAGKEYFKSKLGNIFK